MGLVRDTSSLMVAQYFKRKREGSGEPANAAAAAAGGEAPEGQLRQSPQEMESPALRSPWVPPGKSYVTGILG